jgi:hypothetical protein
VVSHFATDGFALLRADAINRKPSSDAALRSATNLRGGVADAEAETDTEAAPPLLVLKRKRRPLSAPRATNPGKGASAKGKASARVGAVVARNLRRKITIR